MTRMSHSFTLWSCLICALAVPGWCHAQDKKDTEPTDGLSKLIVRFDDLEKSLQKAFGDVGSDIGSLRTELEKQKTTQDGYDDRLKKLEERIKLLEASQTDVKPDPTSPPPPAFPEVKPDPIAKKDDPKIPDEKKVEVVEAKRPPVENPNPQAEDKSKLVAKLFGDFRDFLDTELKKISAEVQNIRTEVKEMKDNNVDPQMKLAKAFERIESLEGQVETLTTNMGLLGTKLSAYESKYPQIEGLGDLKTELDKIGEQLKALQSSKTTVAKSSPVEEGTGIIVMENKFTDEVVFWINTTPYRIPAGRVRTVVDLQPGAYRYRVWYDDQVDLARKDFYLDQGQTVRITAE